MAQGSSCVDKASSTISKSEVYLDDQSFAFDDNSKGMNVHPSSLDSSVLLRSGSDQRVCSDIESRSSAARSSSWGESACFALPFTTSEREGSPARATDEALGSVSVKFGSVFAPRVGADVPVALDLCATLRGMKGSILHLEMVTGGGVPTSLARHINSGAYICDATRSRAYNEVNFVASTTRRT